MVDIFKEIRYTGSEFGLPTPEDMVKAMLDLVPPDFWSNPNARVLEVNIKDMVFLRACYERFRAKLNLSPEYIWGNMLYGACISDALLLVFKNECPEAVNIGAWRDMKLSDMKFDLVVGNPPYNNDAYLDFVMKGHELSKKYSLWITPAKWQGKLDDVNVSFRDRLVPHMDKIVFWPDTHDIFDIRNVDGITYFLCDKESHREKYIKNVHKAQSLFNNETKRQFRGILNNAGEWVVTHLGEFSPVTDKFSSFSVNHFGLGSSYRGGNTEDPSIVARGGATYYNYCTSDEIINQGDVEKYKAVMQHMNGNAFFDGEGTTLALNKIYIYMPGEITTWNYAPIFMSDTLDECESFVSYFDTRFVRFLILCGLCSQSTGSPELYRFVPDPGPFDHIFTDEELYTKYNLSDDQIKVIESVIKSR